MYFSEAESRDVFPSQAAKNIKDVMEAWPGFNRAVWTGIGLYLKQALIEFNLS